MVLNLLDFENVYLQPIIITCICLWVMTKLTEEVFITCCIFRGLNRKTVASNQEFQNLEHLKNINIIFCSIKVFVLLSYLGNHLKSLPVFFLWPLRGSQAPRLWTSGLVSWIDSHSEKIGDKKRKRGIRDKRNNTYMQKKKH